MGHQGSWLHSWLGGGNALERILREEGTPNWIQTSRNINEWKNAIEKAKVHLGI